MNIRTTSLTQTSTAIARLRLQNGNQAQLQDQISSGVRISKASDSPVEFATLLQTKASSQRFDTFLSNMTNASTDLNSSNSAMLSVNQKLARASQIASQGISALGENNEADALATELDGIIDSVFMAANTRVDGKALFGGDETSTLPFRIATFTADGKPATFAYDGSPARARGLIGPQQTVDTRYTGSEIFQAPGNNVFEVLTGLRDDLRNRNLTGQARTDALTGRLANLEQVRNVFSDKIGEQSSTLANLEAFSSRISDLKLDTDLRTSQIESTDYAQAIVQLKEQENIYQATLGVTSRLVQPSLLDFIR